VRTPRTPRTQNPEPRTQNTEGGRAEGRAAQRPSAQQNPGHRTQNRENQWAHSSARSACSSSCSTAAYALGGPAMPCGACSELAAVRISPRKASTACTRSCFLTRRAARRASTPSSCRGRLQRSLKCEACWARCVCGGCGVGGGVC